LDGVEIGKAVQRRSGEKIALLVFGAQMTNALQVAEDINATVIDMRFVKPLDETMLKQVANSHELLVTIEENAIMGGAGSAVAEYLHSQAISTQLLQLGLPDRYIEQGDQTAMLAECGLSMAGIKTSIQTRLNL
jgi:1-deoxy-D-xylulose-5-phosphate synthase